MFLFRYTRPFARSLDLDAKKSLKFCKITRVCVNRILREIRILTLKECEKINKMKFLSKMSG